MLIYILRHGETDYNAKKIMQGQLDTSLNENGRNLAHITGKAIKGLHFDACYSSPLSRAVETAEIVLKESGNNTSIIFDGRLKEIGFGPSEGKSISELKDVVKKLYGDPFNYEGTPGGESLRQVCDRTQSFLKELIKKNDDQTYLVSTHGCAMRAMINYLIQEPNDFWLGHVPYNCSFTVIEVKDNKPIILAIDQIFYDRRLVTDLVKM